MVKFRFLNQELGIEMSNITIYAKLPLISRQLNTLWLATGMKPFQIAKQRIPRGLPVGFFIVMLNSSIDILVPLVIPAPLSSFPRKRESRQDWISHQVRDDGKGWIPNPKRFAFGWG